MGYRFPAGRNGHDGIINNLLSACTDYQ
jgi:hypothetical protein